MEYVVVNTHTINFTAQYQLQTSHIWLLLEYSANKQYGDKHANVTYS